MRLYVCLVLAFGRRHRVVRSVVSSLLLISTNGFAQANTEFGPGCLLPFKAIAVEHPGVDDFCGIEGITLPDDVRNQTSGQPSGCGLAGLSNQNTSKTPALVEEFGSRAVLSAICACNSFSGPYLYSIHRASFKEAANQPSSSS